MPNLLSCHPLMVAGPKELGCPSRTAYTANGGIVVQSGSLWRHSGSGSWLAWPVQVSLLQWRSPVPNTGLSTIPPMRVSQGPAVQTCLMLCWAETVKPVTVQNPHGSKPGLGGVVCLCLQGLEAWLQNWDICVGWWAKLAVHGSHIRNLCLWSCLDSKLDKTWLLGAEWALGSPIWHLGA